ncbi:MAG: hypothetical protein ACPL68_04660, partial [Candidatus Hydrothermia bacterium]
GAYGKGFFSFLGGHDPEDYQHMVGDPPTDLRLHRNSPGYRLILNNVLFPAAKREKLKTSLPVRWTFALAVGPRYTRASGNESDALSWETGVTSLAGFSPNLMPGLGVGFSMFDSRSGELPSGGYGEGYLGNRFSERFVILWDPWVSWDSRALMPSLSYKYEERHTGGFRASPYSWNNCPALQLSASWPAERFIRVDLSAAAGPGAPGVHPGEKIGYPAHPWSVALLARLFLQREA